MPSMAGGPGWTGRGESDQGPTRVGVASQLLRRGEDRGRLQRQGGPESSSHRPPATSGGHQPPAAATSHQRRAGERGVPARLQWREDLGGPGGEEVDQDPARVGVASQLLLCGEGRGRLQRQGGPESSLATSCKPEMEELLHASTGHQPPASSWGMEEVGHDLEQVEVLQRKFNEFQKTWPAKNSGCLMSARPLTN